ncbi:MAG: YfcC family protein [Clostridia bacterium]|nr:YfcC family protein [Clostridia bacterium]
MEKEIKSTKEKSFSSINFKSFLSVIIVLTCIIALSGILTLIIPQGSFSRDENGQIIAGTFVKGEVAGIEFWRVITAPFRVFIEDGGITIIMISLFLLVMSGVFNLLDKTNGLKVIMNTMVRKFGSKKKFVVCACVLFFMLFGSLFGLFEELVTLLPFIVMFMLSLGFDTMTGLGVCLLASCFGFSAAITNPFSVGIASSFAGISAVSGLWLRIVFFALTYTFVCIFLIRYTNKLAKKPQMSLSFNVDEEKRKSLNFITSQNTAKDKKIFKVYLTFFAVEFLVLILSAVIREISGFAVPILAGTFLIGGIISGLLVVDKKSDVFKHIGNGALSMLPAVLLIALASSVNLIMQESGVLDTIMNFAITFLQGKPVFVCALLIYAFILFLQIFIGSASAKIFLIMPILIPICSVIGISPTLLILIYCMADGFSDVILPTNPVLLIALSMSNVSYGKWVKWTWKIQLMILLLSFATIFFAIQIGF